MSTSDCIQEDTAPVPPGESRLGALIGTWGKVITQDDLVRPVLGREGERFLTQTDLNFHIWAGETHPKHNQQEKLIAVLQVSCLLGKVSQLW